MWSDASLCVCQSVTWPKFRLENNSHLRKCYVVACLWVIIDREAGKIIRLVATVCPSFNALTLEPIQNGWVFKMLVVSTGCAIAVDHAFNWQVCSLQRQVASLFPWCIHLPQAPHPLPLSYFFVILVELWRGPWLQYSGDQLWLEIFSFGMMMWNGWWLWPIITRLANYLLLKNCTYQLKKITTDFCCDSSFLQKG